MQIIKRKVSTRVRRYVSLAGEQAAYLDGIATYSVCGVPIFTSALDSAMVLAENVNDSLKYFLKYEQFNHREDMV